MAGVKKGNPAGFHSIQMYTLNSNNYATGSAGTSPANGSTSHALKLGGGRSANFSGRAQKVVEFVEGDKIAGKMAFGGGDIEPFDVEVEQLDADVEVMLSGGSVDNTTNSVWQIWGSNPKNDILPDVGVILSQKLQSRIAATAGKMRYMNYIFPLCSVRMLSGGATWQDKVPLRLQITPTLTTKFPTGVAFGANQSFTDNETDMIKLSSDYPLALTAFISDAAATTFITGYRPVSTTVTAGATPNWFARNGTAQALSSIVVATGVATMSAAGTAADVNVLLYETQFIAI